jgi:hypothetical protein
MVLEIKPWGQKNFSILDPDHNLLTFGQSLGNEQSCANEVSGARKRVHKDTGQLSCHER